MLSFEDTAISKFCIKISSKIIFPGPEKISLLEVTRFFIQSMMSGTLTTRAGSIAFSFFMAIFPAILFLFSLLPHIPIDNFQEILLQLMQDLLPVEAYELSKETVEDIVSRPRDGMLSFSFLMALIFSTNGTNALMEGFNQSTLITNRMSWVKQRILAFFLFLILVSLVLIAVSLIIFNQLAMDYLIENNIIHSNITFLFIQSIRWIIIISLFYFTISFTYYFVPAVKTKWKFLSLGAILTTFFIILTSIAFSYYVNNFGQYNKLYGSIGTLLVIMLWNYLIATFILLGYELNASIGSAKAKNSSFINKA